MNDAVRNLCNALLSVQSPTTPQPLREVFNQFSHVSLDVPDVPEALRALERLVREWETLASSQHAAPQRSADEQNSELQRLRAVSDQIHTEMLRINSTLSTLYTPLEARYNDELRAKHSLAASVLYTGNQQRLALIKEWAGELREKLTTLNLESARIELAACLAERAKSQSALAEQGVTVNASTPDSVADAQAQLRVALLATRDRQGKLQQSISALAPMASTFANAARIAVLEEEDRSLESRLADIQQSLEAAPECKAEWQQEWDSAEDKDALLRDTQTAAQAQSSYWSYLSAKEWREWKSNPQYGQRLPKASFLALFQEQGKLVARRAEIERELTSLRPYAGNAGSSSSSSSIPLDEITIANAVALLADIPDVTLPENPSVDAVYAAMVTGLEKLVTDEITHDTRSSALQHLDDIQQRITTLRADFMLNPDSDALTLAEDQLELLRGQTLKRATKTDELLRLLGQCDDFTTLSERYRELEQQKREIERAVSQLQTQGNEQVKRRRRTAARAAVDPTSAIRADIATQCRILQAHCTELDNRRQERQQVPLQSAAPRAVPDVIDTWCRHLAPLTAGMPRDWQLWYGQLIAALRTAERTPRQNLQISRLLRDFVADLSPRGAHLQTLHVYQQRCPNPAENWQQLLALKPEMPLISSKETLRDSQNELIRGQLNALYQQATSLRERGFLHESGLLTEITRTLHAGALAAEGAHSSHETSPVLFNRDDPRYTCLFRHRGALLNLLERLSHWISSLWSSPENGVVHNQSFFKPTRTVVLLDAAALSCQGALAPV